MNDTALIEALRMKFGVSESEQEYLNNCLNEEHEVDKTITDAWFDGSCYGSIELRANLMRFLTLWQLGGVVK